MPALITWWTMDTRQLAPEAHNDAIALIGSELLQRWSEPVRAYHTTTHLVEMFWALEDLVGAGEIDDHEAALARVAAWFHDAVYDPQAAPGDNEAASSALARSSLGSLRASDEALEAVERLIALTIWHDSDMRDSVDDAFHDADLWILGAPAERFDTYCEQVRAEFAHVPDAAYRRGRTKILEPLAQRDAVYRTAHARAHWQPAARLNLARELARLRD